MVICRRASNSGHVLVRNKARMLHILPLYLLGTRCSETSVMLISLNNIVEDAQASFEGL